MYRTHLSKLGHTHVTVTIGVTVLHHVRPTDVRTEEHRRTRWSKCRWIERTLCNAVGMKSSRESQRICGNKLCHVRHISQLCLTRAEPSLVPWYHRVCTMRCGACAATVWEVHTKTTDLEHRHRTACTTHKLKVSKHIRLQTKQSAAVRPSCCKCCDCMNTVIALASISIASIHSFTVVEILDQCQAVHMRQ